MAQTIMMERFLEQRDVDAALYLLSRMLNVSARTLENRRDELVALKRKLERTRHISTEERRGIVASYREIIG